MKKEQNDKQQSTKYTKKRPSNMNNPYIYYPSTTNLIFAITFNIFFSKYNTNFGKELDSCSERITDNKLSLHMSKTN